MGKWHTGGCAIGRTGATSPRSLACSALLDQLRRQQALCAFNVENFDTMLPAFKAAADVDAPVVIAVTVPVARYLGYEFTARLAELVARRFGVSYALHLDHCEDAGELRPAIGAGFSSANLLNEGALDDLSYLKTATALRREFGTETASFEFIMGTLGHHHNDLGPRHADRTELVAFAQSCRPDILGFHCGSLHGMRSRSQDIDLALIAEVAEATKLPIVLHGSSGVLQEQVLAGIDAGIRKVNIETATRAVFTGTVRTAINSDGPAASKPRYLTMATDEALGTAFRSYLEAYTLRRN